MKKIAAFLVMNLVALNTWSQAGHLSSAANEMFYAEGGRLNYLELKANYRINEGDVAIFINTELLENGVNSVKLAKSEKDDLGFTHLRFDITRDGIPYANKTIIAHCKNGKLISLNGDLYTSAAPETSFGLSEKKALSYALAKVNAVRYKWENKAEERHMREALNDPDFTYDPVGVKVLFESEGRIYSAYRFNIYAEEPLYRANVYVDASSGVILAEHNLICTADVPGSAITKYSGTQTITVDQNGSSFRLRETGRGLGIETYNMGYGSNYSAATDFTNSTANWTITNADQGATDAHWGAQKTYDYYWTQHNRNSINNAGFKLLSYIHYQTNFVNAFWDGARMTYGDGNGSSYKIFTALDICGHEITHGLTSNTGNLIYQNESGALNESFSDIFGAAIENYGRPNNWNWKIGEDITSSGIGLRTMSNPNQFGDPDTYGGVNYYVGTADNGGVHTNSGVGNFWFYLLVTGGSGTNDIGKAYNVSGIGMTDAARIAFRALTVYFTSTTNYAQARMLTLKAARDLFGTCSNQEIQTARAWYAVGIGPNYTNGSLGTDFYASNVNFCAAPATVGFTNTTSGALTYAWDFGDGSVSTSTNTSHTYMTPGSYTVKLKSFGCLNTTDSLVKTAVVVIHPPVPPPTVADVSICQSMPAILNATSSIDVSWYGSPAGGAAISTGTSIVVSNLVANNTYYASSFLMQPGMSGGILSNINGTFQSSPSPWMVFDVVKNGTLTSVVMYASTAGQRTIQLRNSSNVVLQSVTANLTIGANTVPLNFALTPGNNYRLGLSNSTSGNLFRTTSMVSYPYNVGDCIKITGSSQGSGWYYWFYNWKIETEGCESQRVPVNIFVNPNPTVSAAAAATLVCTTDQVELSGEPVGGVFAGAGVTGNSFSAANSGVGAYMVNYSYVDNNGCMGVTSTQITVQECTGISENLSSAEVNVFPNPSSGIVYVRAGSSNLNYTINDVAGKLLQQGTVNDKNQQIDASVLSPGIYLMTLSTQDGVPLKTVKLVKE